ncbi:DgyrCDS4807 [Dimorphilus gyrociliatus]|uniref:DgyrCDS4807 n=1 Tax=Dimorphilus gyrociliatus TaxID=2664684 RepID=A0A7I8VKA3_9ANNE|nr:DgyrCDS4807 [Dimorphilus gyrociliatus]
MWPIYPSRNITYTDKLRALRISSNLTTIAIFSECSNIWNIPKNRLVAKYNFNLPEERKWNKTATLIAGSNFDGVYEDRSGVKSLPFESLAPFAGVVLINCGGNNDYEKAKNVSKGIKWLLRQERYRRFFCEIILIEHEFSEFHDELWKSLNNLYPKTIVCPGLDFDYPSSYSGVTTVINEGCSKNTPRDCQPLSVHNVLAPKPPCCSKNGITFITNNDSIAAATMVSLMALSLIMAEKYGKGWIPNFLGRRSETRKKLSHPFVLRKFINNLQVKFGPGIKPRNILNLNKSEFIACLNSTFENIEVSNIQAIDLPPIPNYFYLHKLLSVESKENIIRYAKCDEVEMLFEIEKSIKNAFKIPIECSKQNRPTNCSKVLDLRLIDDYVIWEDIAMNEAEDDDTKSLKKRKQDFLFDCIRSVAANLKWEKIDEIFPPCADFLEYFPLLRKYGNTFFLPETFDLSSLAKLSLDVEEPKIFVLQHLVLCECAEEDIMKLSKIKHITFEVEKIQYKIRTDSPNFFESVRLLDDPIVERTLLLINESKCDDREKFVKRVQTSVLARSKPIIKLRINDKEESSNELRKYPEVDVNFTYNCDIRARSVRKYYSIDEDIYPKSNVHFVLFSSGIDWILIDKLRSRRSNIGVIRDNVNFIEDEGFDKNVDEFGMSSATCQLLLNCGDVTSLKVISKTGKTSLDYFKFGMIWLEKNLEKIKPDFIIIPFNVPTFDFQIDRILKNFEKKGIITLVSTSENQWDFPSSSSSVIGVGGLDSNLRKTHTYNTDIHVLSESVRVPSYLKQNSISGSSVSACVSACLLAYILVSVGSKWRPYVQNVVVLKNFLKKLEQDGILRVDKKHLNSVIKTCVGSWRKRKRIQQCKKFKYGLICISFMVVLVTILFSYFKIF